MGSTMVPLGGELLSSHRLSIQITLVSGTVWPQFAMWVANPQFGGKGWLYGVGPSEMGPLSIPGTTF